MNIFSFFQKKPTLVTCTCGNMVDERIYRKRLKVHKIGVVFKEGKNFDLYCDGKERI